MESPPSSSTRSEAFVLSDDSGLLLTNSSISSGSMSGDSRSGRHNLHLEFQDSDCEDKSFSQDSLDGMSDIMCGENFNTLKKGPNWGEYKQSSPIEPPLEFQDRPSDVLQDFSECLASQILNRAFDEYKERREKLLRRCGGSGVTSPVGSAAGGALGPGGGIGAVYCGSIGRTTAFRPLQHHHLVGRPYEFIPFSPCHHHQQHQHLYQRPGSSRCSSSLGSSRLSSSHNSLSVPAAHRADDSSFITQAVSHDTLSSNQISDLYNVPFDSDMYAVPIDVVKPPPKPKRNNEKAKRRRRNTSSGVREPEARSRGPAVVVVTPAATVASGKKNTLKSERYHWCVQKENKRHSLAGTSAPIEGGGEPIHMTLQEVRHYLQTLYSSSSDSSEHKQDKTVTSSGTHYYHRTRQDRVPPTPTTPAAMPPENCRVPVTSPATNKENNNNNINNSTTKLKKSTFLINIKNKKVKDSCDMVGAKPISISPNKGGCGGGQQQASTNKGASQGGVAAANKKSPARLLSFKQTLCNMFKFKRFLSPEHHNKHEEKERNYVSNASLAGDEAHNKDISSRALPPLPLKVDEEAEEAGEQTLDFATSIQRVKDYGWYWGPLPSEVAEKILSNEPDGSFIVRDSSDDHYIFSLTFKLNNCVRHVRIDHDQGNFSFGSCTKFKSQTIVEFIENAVEHSRSGRYLFFLHRRPVIGPVRVQLLHPVSRFKQVQSLQHICRFAIHKVVRRDLIPGLPLPRRMIDYLNTPHYYSEHSFDVEDAEPVVVPPRIPTPAIRRDEPAMPNNPPFNNYIVLNNTNPRQS